MNYNVSSYDSKFHSEITDDIAHVLQSDSSESLKRSSSSDYLEDWDCREKIQSVLEHTLKRIADPKSMPRINIRTGGANDLDLCCHRVVKSVSFNECFSNNAGTADHCSCEMPTTITHSITDSTCHCDESSVDPGNRPSTSSVIHSQSDSSSGKQKRSNHGFNLGENDIDDLISKFTCQAKELEGHSQTPPNVPKESLQHDRKMLMRRVNELETEKLDGEKKLLDVKLTLLSVQKERDTLNDQFVALQEEFLAQQVTDHGKSKLQKRISQLEKLNLQTEKDLQNLKACMGALKGEKECLLKKILDLEEELEDQKEKNTKLLRDKEKGRTKVEEANRWVESLREWKCKAVSDMEITKNNVAKFSTLVKQNAMHLTTVRSRNKKLRKKIKKASALLKESKNIRISIQEENAELKSQLTQMKNEVEEKSGEIERSQLDLFETRDMNVALQKRLENVAESKINHTKQSNDVIETLEKELVELKLRTENFEEEHRSELEKLEKEIDTERTMRNFMVISYNTLEEDYNNLYNNALEFRQVMTAVVQGTNFVSGI